MRLFISVWGVTDENKLIGDQTYVEVQIEDLLVTGRGAVPGRVIKGIARKGLNVAVEEWLHSANEE